MIFMLIFRFVIISNKKKKKSQDKAVDYFLGSMRFDFFFLFFSFLAIFLFFLAKFRT